MTFDTSFYSLSDQLAVGIGAMVGNDRKQFRIRGKLLSDELGGGNPVDDRGNRALAESKRPLIERACRLAAQRDSSEEVWLVAQDFLLARLN
jgi:hypothetical protein